MEFDELLRKYLLLEEENQTLRKTLEQLISLQNIGIQDYIVKPLHIERQSKVIINDSEISTNSAKEIVNKYSSSTEKIELFMSLFKGREDVYSNRLKFK